MEFLVSVIVPFQTAEIGIITLTASLEHWLLFLQCFAHAVHQRVCSVMPNSQQDS